MNEFNLNIVGRFWINSHGSSFAGKGKIELLQKILELGTLSKAAKTLKIPYRQAWEKVRSMNKFHDCPVVVLKHGGKEHGKAEVTEFGEKIILAYRNIESDLEKFFAEQSEKLELCKKE